MITEAVDFIYLIGSIVRSICNAMGEAWQFYLSAVSILVLLAIFKQIGYRNGD